MMSRSFLLSLSVEDQVDVRSGIAALYALIIHNVVVPNEIQQFFSGELSPHCFIALPTSSPHNRQQCGMAFLQIIFTPPGCFSHVLLHTMQNKELASQFFCTILYAHSQLEKKLMECAEFQSWFETVSPQSLQDLFSKRQNSPEVKNICNLFFEKIIIMRVKKNLSILSSIIATLPSSILLNINHSESINFYSLLIGLRQIILDLFLDVFKNTAVSKIKNTVDDVHGLMCNIRNLPFYVNAPSNALWNTFIQNMLNTIQLLQKYYVICVDGKTGDALFDEFEDAGAILCEDDEQINFSAISNRTISELFVAWLKKEDDFLPTVPLNKRIIFEIFKNTHRETEKLKNSFSSSVTSAMTFAASYVSSASFINFSFGKKTSASFTPETTSQPDSKMAEAKIEEANTFYDLYSALCEFLIVPEKNSKNIVAIQYEFVLGLVKQFFYENRMHRFLLNLMRNSSHATSFGQALCLPIPEKRLPELVNYLILEIQPKPVIDNVVVFHSPPLPSDRPTLFSAASNVARFFDENSSSESLPDLTDIGSLTAEEVERQAAAAQRTPD